MKYMVQLKINATIECSIHADSIEEALNIAQKNKNGLWDWGKKVDEYIYGETEVCGIFCVD